MRKVKMIISVILVLGLLLGIAGCNSNDNVTVPTTYDGDDVFVTKLPSDEEFLKAIPEQDRELFQSGKYIGVMPDNSEIKRIVLYDIQYDSIYFMVYGVVDFEAKTFSYGTSNGGLYPPDDLKVFELTDEEIATYRDAINKEFLKNDVVLANGYWKIGIEYNDGTRCAYEIDASAFVYEAPENVMINTFFSKIETSENYRVRFGFHQYDSENR